MGSADFSATTATKPTILFLLTEFWLTPNNDSALQRTVSDVPKRPSECTRFEQDEALVEEQLTSNLSLIAEILKLSENGAPKRSHVWDSPPGLWRGILGEYCDQKVSRIYVIGLSRLD